MLKKTKQRYWRLFNYHTKDLAKLNIKTLEGKLTELAAAHPGDYWRELRNAFAFGVQHKYKSKGIDAAKQLKAMKNPVDVLDRKKRPNSRLKGISDGDIEKLKETAKTKGDRVSEAIMTVMNLTGCRPAEARLIVVEKDRIFIPSAKKGRSRGLDRYIKLSTRERLILADRVKLLVSELKDSKDPESLMRKRFSRLAKATFPRRKHLPCLYTLRHEYGANLKSSGRDRFEIAYLMGHQATASVEKYGGRKRATASAVSAEPAVTMEQIKEQVRDTVKHEFIKKHDDFNNEINSHQNQVDSAVVLHHEKSF